MNIVNGTWNKKRDKFHHKSLTRYFLSRGKKPHARTSHARLNASQSKILASRLLEKQNFLFIFPIVDSLSPEIRTCCRAFQARPFDVCTVDLKPRDFSHQTFDSLGVVLFFYLSFSFSFIFKNQTRRHLCYFFLFLTVWCETHNILFFVL